jgi:multidrug efflux system outer membrane protein
MNKKLLKTLATATLLLATAGCAVGPNYKRPLVEVPTNFRAEPASSSASGANTGETAAILGDEQWVEIFEDASLQQFVREALRNNLDLRTAAQRVLEAQAQVGITRSQQLPSVNGGAGYSALQIPSALAGKNSNGSTANSFFNGGGLSASAAWNLDFWGLYRRQTEAARAELLATEWAQRATRSALVGGVALAYFEMRSLDARLEITQSTIKARKESLQLTLALEQHGAASLADVRQAEELLHVAQANLPELRRQIAVQENTLSVLLGHNPGTIERGMPVEKQPHPEQIPLGIPSQLLERRPDIQLAEAKLIAANARIGVAKAQFFPQISLTSLGGSASSQLESVFAGANAYWFAAASLTQPIFDGGRIGNNYRLSVAQQQEMILAYRNTILNALKDVSNSLVTYQETSARRVELAAQVDSAADAVRLARLRYSGGNTSYLEVLTTDTDLYSAQLLLAQAQQQEAFSIVQLYVALGGGWR